MVSMLLVAGSAIAVVNGPEAPDNGAAITAAPDTSDVVTENGTDWSASLENQNSSCMDSNATTGVELGEFSEENESYTVEYSGALQTSNPCVTFEIDVSQPEEDVYRITLEHVQGDEPCVECVGIRNIEGEFTAEGEYRLEIVRDNETLAEAQTPEYEETEPTRSLWQRFLAIFGL